MRESLYWAVDTDCPGVSAPFGRIFPWSPVTSTLNLMSITSRIISKLKSTIAEDRVQNESAYVGAAWFLWGLGFLASGVVMFMWLVFGLAASAGADNAWFLGCAIAAVAFSLVGSAVALYRRSLLLGVALMWALLPLVFFLQSSGR